MDSTCMYTPIIPHREITLDQLYTVHYFENHKNYYFSGEKHDFWEIMYVDRGELIVDTDQMDVPLHLEQGELIFFRPMEFHRTYANSIASHNILVVSFQCSSPSMSFFMYNTRFHINEIMRQEMGILLREAKDSYSAESLISSPMSVQRRADSSFASEQILVMMIELLLIRLIRRDSPSEKNSNNRLASGYVDNAVFFIKQNLRNRISLEDICQFTNISRSQLQKAFQQCLGTSVMRYLTQLRMEEAKFLICTGNKNFTEIAEEFCYSSVHHFSVQFRKTTGMSPTEYANSIIACTPTITQPKN